MISKISMVVSFQKFNCNAHYTTKPRKMQVRICFFSWFERYIVPPLYAYLRTIRLDSVISSGFSMPIMSSRVGARFASLPPSRSSTSSFPT